MGNVSQENKMTLLENLILKSDEMIQRDKNS